MVSSSSAGYAGDIAAAEAWDRLRADPRAQLIDVRTMAEWNFVGLPDLSPMDRHVHCIEWQMFPSMSVNPDFTREAAEALKQAGADRDTPIFLLCRSGGRSRAAAMALTAEGFTAAFNLVGGFEGDLDGERHRGQRGGWKAAGLPWRQS
ncbi:MAG TPA: rhodanese-like domain-containing protein [Rhizomicrobium sp.]|jgi:rhodanese-related sulfurtransferase|nr:rhodanese-like domain-containing protein [Rhizomicrobium sp.]